MSDLGSSPPLVNYKWREITDLSDDLRASRDRELESLLQVWNDQKHTLHDDARVAKFSAELAREWSIETGIIEGAYTLDRGTTQTLIEHGINASYITREATDRDPELVARIIQAHADALEGLFAFIKGERQLTTGYIKELHAALMRPIDTFPALDQFGKELHIELKKGAYKTIPNNPTTFDGSIHEYCPPEHVASEMDRLVQLHDHHAAQEVPTHIEAAWLHHAFTQIHPFQDGNGRVARALASLVFIRAGYFPLVVNRDDRATYIDALETADHGDLLTLVRFFALLQKRLLTRAVGRAVEMKPVATVEEALAVTRDLLVDVGRIIPREYFKANDTASRLLRLAKNRLGIVGNTLAGDVGQVNKGFAFVSGEFGGIPMEELNSIGAQLQYEPNPTQYHQSPYLTLTASGVTSRITVSFHGVGAAFRGLLVAVAYFQSGDQTPIPLSKDVFRITYEDSSPEIENRFAAWLDQCIINGLAEWRRTLV